MKTEHIFPTAHLFKFHQLSQNETQSVWDAIWYCMSSLSTLNHLKEKRAKISELIDNGATFSFATSFFQKGDLDSQISREQEMYKSLMSHLEETCANLGMSKDFQKLVDVIEGRV